MNKCIGKEFDCKWQINFQISQFPQQEKNDKEASFVKENDKVIKSSGCQFTSDAHYWIIKLWPGKGI